MNMNTFTFIMIWSFMSAPTTEFKIKTLPREERRFVNNVLKMHKWETLSDICLTDKGLMLEFPTTVYILRNGYVHQTWILEHDSWVNLGPEVQ
jgi:hypothetical protein